MKTIKILITEDDPDINKLLSKIMNRQGYDTVTAFSGTETLLRLSLEPYDLLLLDLMLPGTSGEDIIQKLRADSDMPVIVLSAKSALEDRVRVLNLGADDYIVKPFEAEEVIARVNAALRRRVHVLSDSASAVSPQDETRLLTYKGLSLNDLAREVTLCGHTLSLTAHEYEILHLMMKNPGKVFSRESLYKEVWQDGYYGEDNTVNVHISNLRRKIAAYDEQEYIRTIWGIGFKLA